MMTDTLRTINEVPSVPAPVPVIPAPISGLGASSNSLFEVVEDSLRKPLCGILMKAPFFDQKNYEKGKGLRRRWTLKMFKFDSDTGVLSYCDATSYQKSGQLDKEEPSVMLGKCQYFHVGAGALCESEPEMDNIDKCQFVFKIDGLTGVHNKTLYLATFTPDDRLKWVSRVNNYTQNRQLDRNKVTEYKRLKSTIAAQDERIRYLQHEMDTLIKLSSYLKAQVRKYQGVATKMREDNEILLDKLEAVSKEITGLRSTLKDSNLTSLPHTLRLESTGERSSDNMNISSSPEFESPEVEYLEQFSRYLDIKRNDLLRMSGRSPGGKMKNVKEEATMENDLSRGETRSASPAVRPQGERTDV